MRKQQLKASVAVQNSRIGEEGGARHNGFTVDTS